VERVVRGQRCLHVSGVESLREPVVGVAHSRDMACGEPGDGFLDCEFLQRAEHHVRVLAVAPVEQRDPGVRMRFGLDKPLVCEAGKGFADGGAGQADSFRQLGIADVLAGGQHAGDDRVA
jgi:hypothetical protein